jgi:hypothetical protein
MKSVIKLIFIALSLPVISWSLPTYAQSSPSVSCRVNGNTAYTGFCTSSAAAASYSIANLLNLGPGNFAVQWNSPVPGNCANNSTICIYSVGATANETEYTTSATITNLDTGAVSVASATFLSQATCYQPPFGQQRGYWFYC